MAERHPVIEVMADRSYRSFWVSSFLSAIIYGGARFAWVWVVLELTDSAADAALVGGFALGLPNLLFSLPAGAFADRFDRRLIVISASLFATGVLIVTGLLTSADRLGLNAALLSAFALGATASIVQPIHTAMVPQLVPSHLHLTGIALQNLSLQSSFFIGAIVTGALIEGVGAGAGFLVLAGLQAASGLSMLPVRLPPPISSQRKASRPSILRSVRDGLGYSLVHQPLRSLTITNFVIGIISASLAILLPDVARNELGRDAFSASLLVAAVIPGMVLMTLWLAARPNLTGRGILTLVGLFSVVPLLAIPGLSDSYWLTLVSVVFWGTPMGLLVTLLRQLTQENTSQEMMGRVMSVVHVFSRGTLPVASVGILLLIKIVPASDALVIVGAAVFFVAVAIAANPAIRKL